MNTHRAFLAGLLSLVCPVFAAAPDRSDQKLRELSVLPGATVTVALSTTQVQRPAAGLSKTELSRRISELQQELKKEPTAEGFYQLGLFLREGTPEETNAFKRAAELFRPRAEARPKDGPLQAQYADALVANGKRDEAERVLRNALKSIPDDWHCWLGLGELLDSRAMAPLFGTNSIAKSARIDQSSARPGQELTGDEVTKMRRALSEAGKAYEQAVRLAPKEPTLAAQQASRGLGSNMLEWVLEQHSGEKSSDPRNRMQQLMSSDEQCALWGRAARLWPTNFYAAGYWGWIEILPGILRGLDAKPLDNVAAQRREHFLEAMRLLEKLSGNANSALTAGAFECLGVLQFFGGYETANARASFRRAVKLDSGRSQAWDGLVLCAIKDAGADWSELVSVTEERLQHDDTARNRIHAVRACAKAGLADKALNHARKATRIDDNDPAAWLCYAALLLRSPDDGAYPKMPDYLKTGYDLSKKLEDGEDKANLMIVYSINLAIGNAVAGQQDLARKILMQLSSSDSLSDDHQQRIKEILTIIGN